MPQAVIVGSGMGGLTAALLLQKHGWQVQVLERHYRPGGFLHRFFRQGIGYDTGFHYVGSAAPDQLFGRAMKHLGVYDRLRFAELDPEGFDWLWFPDRQFKVPAGFQHWQAALCAAFPDEAQGIADFGADLLRASRAYGWFHLDLSTPPESVLPWEECSLQQVVDRHLKHPQLRAIVCGQTAPLYGVAPADAPFGLHAVVTDHFQQGAYTIEGGGDRLARELVRELRAGGGRLHLRCPATAIESEEGVAKGVWSNDKFFPADLVVTDIHPSLVLDLLPRGAVRPAYRDRVKSSKVGVAHVGVYFRVEGDLSALRRRNLYRFRSWDVGEMAQPVRPDKAPPFYFLAAPGAREQGRPGTEQVLVAVMMADYAAFEALNGDAGTARSDAYRAAKAGIEDQFRTVLAEDFPAWTIQSLESSTPLSTRHYTDAPGGAIYGHYHSVAQMGRYRYSSRIKVRGVLQVGHAIGFPGICGAMMSAYVGCSEILGGETLLAELKAA
jgi:all-trans-retinol 13,14-reductase